MMHKNSNMYRVRIKALAKARRALALKRKAQKSYDGGLDDDRIRAYAESKLTALHQQVDRWNRVIEALA